MLEQEPANRGDIRPDPDPSRLTLDALRREIGMLRELLIQKIEAEAELAEERDKRIQALMAQEEGRRRELKVDTSKAVANAIAVQKETLEKMGAALESRIDALRANFETEVRSIRSTQSDLKDRITAIESIQLGERRQVSEQRQISAGAVAAMGLGIAVLLAVLTVVSLVTG